MSSKLGVYLPLDLVSSFERADDDEFLRIPALKECETFVKSEITRLADLDRPGISAPNKVDHGRDATLLSVSEADLLPFGGSLSPSVVRASLRAILEPSTIIAPTKRALARGTHALLLPTRLPEFCLVPSPLLDHASPVSAVPVKRIAFPVHRLPVTRTRRPYSLVLDPSGTLDRSLDFAHHLFTLRPGTL
jgi:hypothetical protein